MCERVSVNMGLICIVIDGGRRPVCMVVCMKLFLLFTLLLHFVCTPLCCHAIPPANLLLKHVS